MSNASSGKLSITQEVYDDLGTYIRRTKENPPPYSLLYGSHCTSWVMAGLAEAGIIPSSLSSGMVPNNILVDFLQTLIWNPLFQFAGFHIYDMLGAESFVIFDSVFDYAIEAYRIITRKDPLALDLNNDGISTISANEGILFDHNNAGVRFGTGWLNPNDGWLALDRNGNGKIDSGRELFGDNTRKLNGNFAAHAYDALKSFDTNNDGKVDVADATGDADSSGAIDGSETYWDINNNGEYDAGVDKTFADLRVWVDTNSNGVTDSGELKTLAALNIVSIGTGKTAVNVADENGNLNTFKGNYTNTSGELVDGTRSFNLLQNTFHRDWPNGPNIPPDVAALPNMQGSGAVRNLHEAMSLGTAQSLVLKTVVECFVNDEKKISRLAA